MEIILFYVPTPSQEDALRIGGEAIRQSLAACTNIFPIQSAYTWQGAVRDDTEYILVLKTTVAGRNTLQQWLESVHPYEVPCIASWQVEVNPSYGQWVAEQVKE